MADYQSTSTYAPNELHQPLAAAGQPYAVPPPGHQQQPQQQVYGGSAAAPPMYAPAGAAPLPPQTTGYNHQQPQQPMMSNNGNDPYAVNIPLFTPQLYSNVVEKEDRAVVHSSPTVQDAGKNSTEKCSLSVGWMTSIFLWVHLLVFIPMCEATKDNPNALCGGYYWLANRIVFYVVFGILYIFYLVSALSSPTRKYLSNALPIKAEDYIQKLWKARPACWFTIRCYHYETRTRTTTDSDGNTSTETYQETVTTHRATAAFNFDTFQSTGDALTLPSNAKATRLRLEKRLTFADQYTCDRYEREFALFVQMNDRDTHKDISRGFELDGFNNYILAFDDPAHPPTGFSLGGYLLCTFLTLSIPYRHFVLSKSVPIDWTISKKIGCSPQSQQQPQPLVQQPAMY